MISPVTPNRIAAPSVADARAPNAALKNAGVGGRVDAVAASAPSLTNEPRRMAAEGPPIDTARVERLRMAIADDSFIIDPARIAAAMISAEQLP